MVSKEFKLNMAAFQGESTFEGCILNDFRPSQACLHSRHCCSRKAGQGCLASAELQVVLLYYLGPSEAIARPGPGDKRTKVHQTSSKTI